MHGLVPHLRIVLVEPSRLDQLALAPFERAAGSQQAGGDAELTLEDALDADVAGDGAGQRFGERAFGVVAHHVAYGFLDGIAHEVLCAHRIVQEPVKAPSRAAGPEGV